MKSEKLSAHESSMLFFSFLMFHFLLFDMSVFASLLFHVSNITGLPPECRLAQALHRSGCSDTLMVGKVERIKKVVKRFLKLIPLFDGIRRWKTSRIMVRTELYVRSSIPRFVCRTTLNNLRHDRWCKKVEWDVRIKTGCCNCNVATSRGFERKEK